MYHKKVPSRKILILQAVVSHLQSCFGVQLLKIESFRFLARVSPPAATPTCHWCSVCGLVAARFRPLPAPLAAPFLMLVLALLTFSVDRRLSALSVLLPLRPWPAGIGNMKWVTVISASKRSMSGSKGLPAPAKVFSDPVNCSMIRTNA